VRADLQRRRGNVAEAGRIAQEVHRWATGNHSVHTVARGHFVLSAVLQELGDVSDFAHLDFADPNRPSVV
jgi:hypothetical protein